jgi:transposase
MISYTADFKISTVKRFLASGESQGGFAARAGLSRSSVRIWVARFQSSGAKGMRKQKTGLSYDAQFKLKALRHLWNNSLTYANTERLFDIRSSGLLAKWEQRYLSSGMSGLRRRARGSSNSMPNTKINPSPAPSNPPDDKADKRSREALLAELAYLRAENAYLKKLDALIQSKRQSAAQKKRGQ